MEPVAPSAITAGGNAANTQSSTKVFKQSRELRERKRRNMRDKRERDRAAASMYILLTSLIVDAPLNKIKRLWEMVHDAHKSKLQGVEILKYLSSVEGHKKQVEPQKLELKNTPTGAEILLDVMKHKDFSNHVSGVRHSEWTWEDFMKGWEAMRDHGDPTIDHHTPLIAFDVVSSPSTYLISVHFLIVRFWWID
jgi:hypothetical protein